MKIKGVEKISLMFVDEKGDLICKADYSEWNKLVWYKKIFGKLYPKYKKRFIKYKGFELK